MIAQKEAYWRQRAKMFCLKDGDINSTFFHNAANTSKKSNVISSLVGENGDVVYNHNDTCEIAISYFNNSF